MTNYIIVSFKFTFRDCLEYFSCFKRKKGDTCTKLSRNGGRPEGLVYMPTHLNDDAEANMCACSLQAIESLREKPLDARCISVVVIK